MMLCEKCDTELKTINEDRYGIADTIDWNDSQDITIYHYCPNCKQTYEVNWIASDLIECENVWEF